MLLTGSRCPVNHPEDKSTKSYHLTYEVQWTRDLTAVKPLWGGVLDISNGDIEWNVGPNLNIRKKNGGTICTDTMCNTTYTTKVGGSVLNAGFGALICPGEMLWSYLHQHIGAINGTMFVNGKPICTSYPIHGTDPNNTPGNELGYIVSFHTCIDNDARPGTSVRLEKDDVITVEGLYDVDVASKTTLPIPGGKHGGVMGLYFFSMLCDPGYGTEYFVCRHYDGQGVCIPQSQFIPPAVQPAGHYTNLTACEAVCS